MEQIENQNTNQQPTTQPADNGDQGGGKMFTQEEVNNIVRDRLARERFKNSPQEPTEEEKRMNYITARENKLACREYVMEQGLPAQLLDVLDTSNHEEFKTKAEIVSGLLKTSKVAGAAPDPALADMKARIAKEIGIPLTMAQRLSGVDEKTLREDAQSMARDLRHYKGAAPLAETDVYSELGIGTGFKNTKHTPKSYY